MEGIMKILENQALINGISLIVSVAVPILVMVFTLRSQTKRFKKENKVKKKQFRKTLKKNDVHHEESMRMEKEKSRICQLPFLFLKKDVIIEDHQGICVFPLEITNIGSGTALDVSVETVKVKDENDKEGSVLGGMPFVHKEIKFGNVKIYRYTSFLSTNAIPVNSNAMFKLSLNLYKNGLEISQEDHFLTGEVEFAIKYKDIHYKKYRQKYMFQYGRGIGVAKVESYLPHLIKKDSKKKS